MRLIALGAALLCSLALADGAHRLTEWPSGARTPDFRLQDADGRVRTLADYRGKVVAVFFGFTHCPDACPAELFKLALAMKKMGALSDRVQVLLVTLDPARDTPKLLREYVQGFDVRFVGLSGSAAQIAQAASDFHVQFARVPLRGSYTIDHSTATYLLDAGGRLRLVGGLQSSADDFAHDLASLAGER